MKDTTVSLSRTQLEAAFIACSNYTPPRGEPWKQRAQSVAAQRLREGLYRARAAARATARREGKQ